MASLKIEIDNNKSVRTLEVNGKQYVSTSTLKNGVIGTVTDETLVDFMVNEYMDKVNKDDDLYEAVDTLDSTCDELEIIYAIKEIEEKLENERV